MSIIKKLGSLNLTHLWAFTSTSALYKNLSARGVGVTATHNLYFKTSSISPELIQLGN